MKKTVTPFTAQLVTFDTTSPVQDVIARLDEAVNKSGSARFLAQFRATTSKTEIEGLVRDITRGNDFLYFQEANHAGWLNNYDGGARPVAVVYTIGNPLIAHTILRHDIRAGYAIPPHLMILGNASGTGTTVIYHLPSSVLALTNNPDLAAAVKVLDKKLEQLVSSIAAD